jgi:hypothetical protein
MLFIYLFFIDFINNPVNILFISSRRRIKYFSDIDKQSIVGIVTGKKVMNIFYDRYPWLMQIFEFPRFSNTSFDRFTHRDFIYEYLNESLFHNCYSYLREYMNDDSEFLSEENVVSWFGNDLNSKVVNLDDTESNNKHVKNAIEHGDDLLLIVKNGAFRSAIKVCKVTRNISLKVINNVVK